MTLFPSSRARQGLAVAALAGVLQALSMAWPGSGQAQGWLQVLSLALFASGLIRQAQSDEPLSPILRAAAWRTAIFALFWLTSAFWWLYVSMHEVGGLPAPLAVMALLLLGGALALFYVGPMLVWVTLVRRAGWLQRPLAASGLFTALWLLADLMRGRWFTGFPWAAGGYAHVDSWLALAAPWVGVYGMGALAALLAMRLAWPGQRWRAAGLLTVVLGGLHLLPSGESFTRSAGTAQVELLQANISQNDKFDVASGIRDALLWYGQRLKTSSQPLVIAPETAIPILPQLLPSAYWTDLQAHFAQGQQLALVGVPWGNQTQGYANALVALGPKSMPEYRYDKFHLVPFGEFIPPGFGWFVRQMQIPLGDFTPGSVHQPSVAWQGQRLAPNICYEDLFGEELAQRFRDGEVPPTVLVNVSNIGWFGNTVAVDQHLNISRLRAMELSRPMLRATNTGATAIIDHRGQVTGLLPRFTRGSLTGRFEGRDGITPYARWAAALGLWPLWLLALLVVGWAAWAARRR